MNQVKLRHHPTLRQITCHDHFALTSPVDIQGLPLQVAQTLLDLSPVLVCKKPDEPIYWQLNSNPTLELLKQHPEQHKLYVSMLYMPAEVVDDTLTGALLFAPALNYRENNKLLSNLSHRTQQAKSQLNQPPSKKKLAQWANVKPSAIRKEKRTDKSKEISILHG